MSTTGTRANGLAVGNGADAAAMQKLLDASLVAWLAHLKATAESLG